MLFNNTVADLLAIAAEMLDGELLYRRGDYDERSPRSAAASSSTTTSRTTSPGAGCSRPATPTAHCSSSRATSRRPPRSTAPTSDWTTRCPRASSHPSNVWSLHGYHECLTRLGRSEEADEVRTDLDAALAQADRPDRRLVRLPDGSLRHAHLADHGRRAPPAVAGRARSAPQAPRARQDQLGRRRARSGPIGRRPLPARRRHVTGYPRQRDRGEPLPGARGRAGGVPRRPRAGRARPSRSRRATSPAGSAATSTTPSSGC